MREKLIKLVCEMWHTDRCIAGCNYPPCYEVRFFVDNLIANDVVPVVRCKDCIYNETGGCEHSESADAGYRPDYFCADGERKENGD